MTDEERVALFAPPEFEIWSQVFDWKIKGIWIISFVLIDRDTGAILASVDTFKELNKRAMEKYNDLFERIVLA